MIHMKYSRSLLCCSCSLCFNHIRTGQELLLNQKCGSSFRDCKLNPRSVTIKMKATEQYFPVVLFFVLYKVVLTFESANKFLKCDHSNEIY